MIELDVTKTRVYQEGFEVGLLIGRAEVKARLLALRAVARRMLKMGRPIEEIVFATTLTPAQVRMLKTRKQTRRLRKSH